MDNTELIVLVVVAFWCSVGVIAVVVGKINQQRKKVKTVFPVEKLLEDQFATITEGQMLALEVEFSAMNKLREFHHLVKLARFRNIRGQVTNGQMLWILDQAQSENALATVLDEVPAI